MSNPAITERLLGIARHAATLGHGAKTAYLSEQAEALGWSMDKLYRHLKKVAVQTPRKRRADAGNSSLTIEEAQLLSGAVIEGARKNGKRIMSIGRAAKMLRANGLIRAEYIDADGVCTPLSETTLARALREYALHPDQLLAPAPAVHLKSKHPNHVWQIDPSLCVLYYLPRMGKDSGLRVMEAEEFYKNKPKNIIKVVNDRVWRYTGTDHYSDVIVPRYYFGGETSANLCDFLIHMMQAKADITRDPIRGVPVMVMLDPGSANTSAAFKTLCAALGIHVQINKPKNPRAKGSVEKGNDLVETEFESGLRFINVTDIDQLNTLAENWMRYYNSAEIHSRHGMTRYQCWNRITADQLVLAPPAEHCRDLAYSAPKEARVNTFLEIKFAGQTYSVKDVPNVMVGQKVMVAKNPWRVEAAQVAYIDASGQECWHIVEPTVFDEAGFAADAVTIGEQYKAHADTIAQTNAKAVKKLTMGAATLDEVEAKTKAGVLPFGGRIDPYAHQAQTTEADNTLYLPKAGRTLDVNRMEVTSPHLNFVQAAQQIKAKADADGRDWARAAEYLKRHHADGMGADEVQAVYDAIYRGAHLKVHSTTLKTGTHE